MVALAAQQLSVRPLAVSVRGPSAAQGRRCTLVVQSQKAQNEAERAAQQAVRYGNLYNAHRKVSKPSACMLIWVGR